MVAVPGRNRTGHGGNIHAVLRETGDGYGEIIDFSANINPLGPPEWLRPLVSRELEKLQHYPDPDYSEFTQSIADFFQVNPAAVVPANGSTDLLYVLPRILGCRRALIPVPSYIDYERAAKLAGLPVQTIALSEKHDFALPVQAVADAVQENDLVIFATPNNPTGATVDQRQILSLAADFPNCYFLIDEAFLDFVPEGRSVGGQMHNILTLNSMTKFFAVPGLRLGFGIFSEDIADQVRNSMPPWTLNSLAQSVGIRALKDRQYQENSRALCRNLREELVGDLQQFTELTVYPSQANYVFIRLTGAKSVASLAQELLRQGILIRCCDNYKGIDDSFFRVAVRTRKENLKLLAALQTALGNVLKRQPLRKTAKTPALMFQGTSSNAGKSVLTAALCRILLQDGIRVAPFKAQNMSLNSYVTLQGEEMGRAQVVQAQAAKLDPDVRMNPILLKPNSDTGSQIIVHGHPVGNMSVNQYSSYKPQAWQAVCESYDSLADEFQAIILEGAGSPGEVNLKSEDIVNMKMARYADAPVLLVGDIDRGGVYASFVGTMEVLAEWERELIAGFVVNRFRGQASLLEKAHEYLLEHTGRSTFGVIPYIHRLGLPEEDSVSFKEGLFAGAAPEQPYIEIAVLNFPHISNFTDVEPFLAEPDVHLRIVNSADEIGEVDAIILPGSKNVIGDLKFVQEKGFADVIRKKASQGCEIVGVCGGYQILGRKIKDPYGIESSMKQVTALELLDIATELKAEKTLTRRNGTHIQSGCPVFGYEIHHGISTTALAPSLKFDDGSNCGAMTETTTVWGTYLHGIFDSDIFRRWFIDNLRRKKGLVKVETILAPYDLEAAFDRVADNVRNNIDMDAVYSLLRV